MRQKQMKIQIKTHRTPVATYPDPGKANETEANEDSNSNC